MAPILSEDVTRRTPPPPADPLGRATPTIA
jgi:hypothetical protein